MEKMTALVTGASGGIGEELARLFAADGHDLVLVARSRDKLARLAEELRAKHAVDARVLAADLVRPEAPREIFEELGAGGTTVDALVNNAGVGSYGLFAETDLQSELDLLQLNVAALTHLTKLFLPGMLARRRGYVMNVASTAAFQPLPRQGTYSASKAFVLGFTEVLSSDLKGTGVSATALCPGPVKTEFTDQHEGFDVSTPEFVWMSAEECAKAAVKGLERGKRVVVPGVGNRIGTLAGQHAPRSVLLAAARRFYPLGR